MPTAYPTGTNSASDSFKSFDIREHLDRLTPGKEKDKYICPVCEGHNLSIDSKTGKYHCFNSDCAPAAIREAIKPWAEVLAEREAEESKLGNQKPKKKVVAVQKTIPLTVTAPIPTGLKLLKLPAPQQGPEPHKPDYFPKGVPADALQIDYKYSENQIALRWQWPDSENPKGHSKTCRPRYIDGDGNKLQENGPLPWPAYRLDEVVEILKSMPNNEPVAVLMVEGEPNVELARGHGIAALTMQGTKWNHPEMITMVDALRATGKQVVLAMLRDNDDTGIKKASEVLSLCNWAQSVAAGIPCIVVDPRVIFPDIPEKGDIKEILDNMDIEDFIQKIEAEIHAAADSEKINEIPLPPRARTEEYANSVDNGYIPDTAPIAEKNFVQKADDALYSDGDWVSISGILYKFTGNHYEEQLESVEKNRIRKWLNTYSEPNRIGVYVCSKAKSTNITEVFQWMTLGLAVDIKTVNPVGLNCENGVVSINRDGSHSLAPNNPEQIYTYVGCKYDPAADSTDCDRLLECLAPPQREIFLRTAAAALCLPLARLKMSRVKGLLCHGDGSNGKDTLRTALSAVLGQGMTGKSLMDFKIYDSGKKFPLAGLENSLCNWSSENVEAVRLDKLQSLKSFITGDEITIEHKGRGEYPYKPQAIFLANCNNLPSISSDAEAIKSRYCILSFDKTYVVGARSSRGEIEADPRFKEDPDFIRDVIAPALLNKMLERLPLLLSEGIDYGSGEAALHKAQENSQHLWQFVRDLGYEVGKGDRVYAKDLWRELQDWYMEAGILEIDNSNKDKEKLIWNEIAKHDNPIKSINGLYARFRELFPKLERCRHTERELCDQTMGSAYYLGICKQKSETSEKSSSASSASSASHSAVDTTSNLPQHPQNLPQHPQNLPQHPQHPYSAVDIASELPQTSNTVTRTAEAVLRQTILTQSGAEDAEDDFSLVLEICNLLSQLTDRDRRKLAEILTQPQSQSQPEQPTPPKPQSQPQPTQPPKTMHRKEPITVGDRVAIIVSHNPAYLDLEGEVIDEWFLRDNKQSYTVKFDELVDGVSQGNFPESDIYKIS